MNPSSGWSSASPPRERCVETLVQQARALIMSGTHGHVFLELCCVSYSELAAAVVEHSVAIELPLLKTFSWRVRGVRCAVC